MFALASIRAFAMVEGRMMLFAIVAFYAFSSNDVLIMSFSLFSVKCFRSGTDAASLLRSRWGITCSKFEVVSFPFSVKYVFSSPSSNAKPLKW